ncbi:MAG: phosphoribosyltransferase family protein [Candidatus Roizmanbacteria bacterium]|nr:phosphoribosyltransferase family protein [Candidatus Roizmanbacteria bacterium]
MLFQDRLDAGNQLADRLAYYKNNSIVVSLLRGGVIVGDAIAKKLKIPHLFLAVVKISHPYQPELAIGALCFNKIYLDNQYVSFFDKKTTNQQIKNAKIKFSSYLKRFNLKKLGYKKLKSKAVILVDDGIATGATIKAGLFFIKSQKPKKIILAVPVAPADFENPGFDEIIILNCDPSFSAVSQFYESFPQVEDKEIFSIY